MAYTDFITLGELEHFTPGELKAMLEDAYRSLSACSNRHSIERLQALVTIQNITTALAVIASGPRWECVDEELTA